MKTLDAKRVLEAALICSSQPMALREMSALFAGEVGNDTLRTLLAELADECKERAVELVAVASGWRYQTRPEMAPYLVRLDPERAPRYSRAVLETLAIIAYRQPCTRPEIEAIRGVDVDAVLSTLLERRMIRILGRKEAPGRPILYGTTREFLEVFSLPDLDALPPLRDLGELAEAFAAQEAAAADGDAAAVASGNGHAGAEPPAAPEPAHEADDDPTDGTE